MVRVRARLQQGRLVLDEPLDLVDGTEVLVEIHPLETDEQNAWEMACSRLESELELSDSSYDDWRKLYGVVHHADLPDELD